MLKLISKATMKRRIIELFDYDFAWMRELERARLRGKPDISPVKIYDAINEKVNDVTLLHDIMRSLDCPCEDDDDGERCLVIRIVEVDDGGLIVDDHPSEG